MNRVKQQQGFTIIELMLSMTFVAILLLGIAMTIIQVGNIYNKGMALRQINQSARDISDDLRKSVSGSSVTALAQDYIEAAPAGPDPGPGGRLCLGSFSYVWNFAKSHQGEENAAVPDPNIIRYTSAAKRNVKINLLKIPDGGKMYCQKNSTGKFTYQSVQAADETRSKELLAGGDHTIGLQKFAVALVASDAVTTQKMYTLDFILGTGSVTAMNADQSACLPPNDLASDIAYCNVREFNLVLRAGNRVN